MLAAASDASLATKQPVLCHWTCTVCNTCFLEHHKTPHIPGCSHVWVCDKQNKRTCSILDRYGQE